MWTGFDGGRSGVRAFVERHGSERLVYYASGKFAFRDGLALLASDERARTRTPNVVLPACVPSALVEPIREAGYEPRFHAVTRDLRPDLADVDRALDDDTVALVVVDYFGFSQPAHAELRELADGHGAALVEDNAHAALSTTADGRLLGTRGDLGFTSFRKTLPVRDGAVLFVDGGLSSDGPWQGTPERWSFPRSGVAPRYTGADVRYVLGAAGERLPVVDGLLGTVAGLRRGRREGEGSRPEHGGDLHGRNPAAIYERSKGPMSKLSATVLDRIDPASVIASKRQHYRTWLSKTEHLDGVAPVFESLPAGTCPQSFPVVAERTDELGRRPDVEPADLRPWPPLPSEVVSDDRFETAQYLARNLIPLPV